MMPSLSLICLYDHEKKYRFYLGDTLRKQTVGEVETILLDNSGGRYKSAAEAYNEGLRQASGDLVMIASPDTRMYDEYFLEDILKFCGEAGEFGAAGLVGVFRENGKRKVISNSAKTRRTEAFGEMCDEVREVDLVDGTFLVLSRKLIDQGIRFRDLGKTRELYAEDICLQSRAAGLKVVYLPAQVIRIEPPKADLSYLNGLDRLKTLAGIKEARFATSLGDFPMEGAGRLLRRAVCLPASVLSRLLDFLESVR